ncbi:MAG TPA: O-antigen ligase family protein [Oligoflexia bacterium]|nr:O-antigen ligase family protein [Oligoflexia bacterium]HMP26967.1 O-antigen ligase family protein [Oligoflexia bacterium]
MPQAKDQKLFEKYAHTLLLGLCFFIPIRLVLALLFLVPLAAIWSFSLIKSEELRKLTKNFIYLNRWLFIFLTITLLTISFSFNPKLALKSFFSHAGYSLALLAISGALKYSNSNKLLVALFSGQTIAAIHTIIEDQLPIALRGILIGELSESGQLALVIPLLVSFFINHFKTEKQEKTIRSFTISNLYLVGSLVILCLAIIINLKRGPWLGCAIGISVILLKYANRWIFPFVLSILLTFSLIAPIRDRLLASYQHFQTSGGRETIWKIGTELISDNPLGIGIGNARIIKNLSFDIPDNLKHFHNNFLNILVETGWCGLAAFLCWIYTILAFGFKKGANHPLAFGISGALLSWQIAGLVEYNFGDSEVLIVAYILIAILSQRH